MPKPLTFIVVEDRQGRTLASCCESARRAGERLVVLGGTDAGADYDTLRARYVHLSSNTAAFELVCFRRYFLLAKHLAANPDCREFVLIDSDVLLMRGVGAHVRQLVGQAAFSGSAIRAGEGWEPCQISPHLSYWRAQALTDFVAFVLATYASAQGLAQLQVVAARFAARGLRGGVSDMTLLYLWAYASGNTAPINRVQCSRVIDHNINTGTNLLPGEFRERGAAKRLSRAQGRTFFTATADGSAVEAMALHFQGRAKLAMALVLEGRLRRAALLSAALGLVRSLKNTLFRARSALLRTRTADPFISQRPSE